MKIIEVLSDDCKAGNHESPDGKGCRGRGRANDPKTQIGHYAGEQVRTWCPCECHQPKTTGYVLPRAIIPPLNLPDVESGSGPIPGQQKNQKAAKERDASDFDGFGLFGPEVDH